MTSGGPAGPAGPARPVVRTERRPLRLSLALPYYEPDADLSPSAIAASPFGELARALAALGHHVHAVQLARRPGRLELDGVKVELVATSPLLRRASELLFAGMPRYGPAYYEPSWRLAMALGQGRPEAVHVSGLTMDANLALSAVAARRSRAPLLVHFHGGAPDADRLTMGVRRRTAAQARRVLFTHPDQARPWIEAGVLSPAQVGQALETSARIRPVPRDLARSRTGIQGDPACLMVGRLDAIKDPLTTLTGFALLAERRPLATLHVFPLTDTLRRECEALARALPVLAGRVFFHPARPRAQMAEVYSSADLLLQSSRREWSSLTVIEAMACGCVPVLSAIPAFRALTGEGAAGRLFPPGRPDLLADRALLGLPERRAHSQAVVQRFRSRLSFEALAGDLERHVLDLLPPRATG